MSNGFTQPIKMILVDGSSDIEELPATRFRRTVGDFKGNV